MTVILPLLIAVASATVPNCAKGDWTMMAGDRAVFQLQIKDTATGPTAAWGRPDHFESDGDSFTNVRGPAVRRPARSVAVVDTSLVLSFDDPRPGATPDVFRVRCKAPGHLEVVYDGTDLEPFDFVKAGSTPTALGPWDSTQRYVRTIDRPTNGEMTAIFTADQADRTSPTIDWAVVSAADATRRKRTQELLDAGLLNSGDDFYHAAFVFQHGGAADSYLKAHLLAMIATARGKSAAIWIASATLDRYLQAIGKPQVLGTQFKVPNGGTATQEPYDRALVSDAMRKALRVPSLAEQERKRQAYSAKAGVATKR